jgi:hypothetical protein
MGNESLLHKFEEGIKLVLRGIVNVGSLYLQENIDLG